MNIKGIIIFLAAALFLICGDLQARDFEGQFSLGIFGGLGLPTGDLGDDDLDNEDGLYRNAGYKGGLQAEYFVTNNIAVGLNFMYSILPNKVLDGFDPNDELVSIFYGAHGRYVFRQMGDFYPYGLVAVGLVDNTHYDSKLQEQAATANRDFGFDPFVSFAAGATYRMAEKVTVFLELGYDLMLTRGSTIEIDGTPITDPDTGEPLELDANYYFGDLRLGFNYWFGE